MQLNVKIKKKDLLEVFEKKQEAYLNGTFYHNLAVVESAIDDILDGIIHLHKGQASKYLVIKIMNALGIELEEE